MLAITSELRKAKLSETGLSVLICIYEEGPQTIRGLAKTLGCSKPNITRAADRLEHFGYVERLPDTTDGRSIILKMSPAGKKYYIKLVRQMVQATVEPTAAAA